MRLVSVFLFALVLSVAVKAAIIVDVQDASISVGQNFSVDVLVSADAGESVDLTQYIFVVSNVGAPSSSLSFAAVGQPTDQLTDENGEMNYIFFGDTDPTTLEFAGTTPTSLIGGDFTNSGNPLPLTGTRLLVRIELDHQLGPGQDPFTAVGEQFQVTLQDDPETFFDDNGDPDDGSLMIAASSFNPAIGGGTITVTAVPEPSSVFALAALGALSSWRHRRKKSRNEVLA